MVIRRTPQPFPTPEQAHAELVQLDAEDTELRTQVLAIARRRQEISGGARGSIASSVG